MLGAFFPQFFLGRAQRGLCDAGWPIFIYHKINTPATGARDPFLFVTPDRFRQQLGALRQAGFSPASLSEMKGVSGNPNRRAVITFDDGAQSVFINALKPLADHKFRAIEFIVAGLIGKRNEWDMAKGELEDRMMDETQIREWLKAGHEIGSHTLTHPNLKRVSLALAREEIFGSKKKLEDTFGVAVRHFCYPSGKWNEPVRDLVGEAGYETACTVQFGVNTSTTPQFALNRMVPLSDIEWLRKAKHRLMQRVFPAKPEPRPNPRSA